MGAVPEPLMRPSADPPGRSDARSIRRRTAATLAAAVAGVLMAVPMSGPARAGTAAVPLVWSTLSPAASPPPLAYPAAAYDSDNDTMVLFGGVASSGALSNSTWVWNGSTWRDYPGSQIVAPQARELAAMAFDPVLHQLVLFGGRGPGGELLGDTWAWNGASWYQVTQKLSGQAPGPREGAAMAYDGHGNLVLFGGDGPVLGAGAGTTTAGPSGTAVGSHAGGSGVASTTGAATSATAVALGDTWLWTSSGWVASPAAGPGARTAASLAYDSGTDSVVMFGGSSSPVASGSPAYLSDTWTWNGSTWSAAPAPTAGTATTGAAPAPGPRFGAAAAYDPPSGGVVLFGGSGPGGFLSDTWLWDGDTWSAAAASGDPGARAGVAAAYDTAGQQLVVFGGAGKAGSAGGTADAGGNYGSTLGGAAAVLGGTSVLTAGAPLDIGSPPAVIPATGGATPATSVPGAGASRESALPGAPGVAAPSDPGTAARGRPTLSPLRVLHRGQLVTLRGAGFLPRSKVTVTFHSTPAVVGTTTAGAAGGFEVTVSVPQSAAAGTHRFVASGEGPNGPLQLLIATVKVVAGAAAPPTGATTAERAALVGLALALPLATWLAMGAFGRWRRGGYRISSQRQDS